MIPDRFWQKVDKSGDCWLWTGATKDGYGIIALGKSERGHDIQVKTHRLMWESINGPIPAGMYICHTCDVRNCVRPEHLWLGTHEDNQADKVAKGRQGHGGGLRPGRGLTDRNPTHMRPEIVRGERNPNARVTALEVEQIRALYAAGGISQAAIGESFGLKQPQVSRIVRRESWRAE